MLWIAAALLGMFVVWYVLRSTSRARRATPMGQDDPWLLAAIERAREAYPDMLALVQSGQEVAVKFPLANADGDIEHVWGGVTAADETGVEVSIVTPLLVGPTPEGARRLARDTLEDWQAFLTDGGIRGGFTTQAQLAVCKREGLSIPRSLVEQDLRFLDPIEFSPSEKVS